MGIGLICIGQLHIWYNAFFAAPASYRFICSPTLSRQHWSVSVLFLFPYISFSIPFISVFPLSFVIPYPYVVLSFIASSPASCFMEIPCYEENHSLLMSWSETVGQEASAWKINSHQYHYEDVYIWIDQMKSKLPFAKVQKKKCIELSETMPKKG